MAVSGQTSPPRPPLGEAKSIRVNRRNNLIQQQCWREKSRPPASGSLTKQVSPYDFLGSHDGAPGRRPPQRVATNLVIELCIRSRRSYSHREMIPQMNIKKRNGTSPVKIKVSNTLGVAAITFLTSCSSSRGILYRTYSVGKR